MRRQHVATPPTQPGVTGNATWGMPRSAVALRCSAGLIYWLPPKSVLTVRSTLTLLTSVVVNAQGTGELLAASNCLCFGFPGTVLRLQHNLALLVSPVIFWLPHLRLPVFWVTWHRLTTAAQPRAGVREGHVGSRRTAPRQALLLKLACDQVHPPALDVLGKLTALYPAGNRGSGLWASLRPPTATAGSGPPSSRV